MKFSGTYVCPTDTGCPAGVVVRRLVAARLSDFDTTLCQAAAADVGVSLSSRGPVTSAEGTRRRTRQDRHSESTDCAADMDLRSELLKSIWYGFTALDLERSGKVSKSQLKVGQACF